MALVRSLAVVSRVQQAIKLPFFRECPALRLRSMKGFCSSSVSAKIPVNGVELHYEQAGTGAHALLCLPGALGSAKTDFGPQLHGLSNEFTVVAFDPRGYGKSIPPSRDFPNDFYVRDAIDGSELMKQLGFTNYSLLGWSDGGISAMILAATNQAVVHKMVVWGANASVTKQDMEMYEKTRDIEKWNPKMRDPLEALYGEQGLKSMWTSWLTAIQWFFKQNKGNICQELLPQIKCPTLIVHGEKDPMVPQSQPDYMHEHIKGSVMHLMPEGRHNLHLRYADEFNAVVVNFLKD